MSTLSELVQNARRIRTKIITMLELAGSGHPGGSLSVTDILVALYDLILIDPNKPDWEYRDRVVLSKGHAAPALYAVLQDKGFFEEKELYQLRKFGGKLQGHPDMRKTPGVDASTGSLGQGISTAIGIALAGRLQKLTYRVYAILGDGELQEGIVWEALTSAIHYKLDNLVVIVDYNKLQIDGSNEEVMSVGNLPEKFHAFGFHVIELDGHNITKLQEAYKVFVENKPICIIAHTIKGKGVSFMEDKAEWHGQAVSKELSEIARKELEEVR